MRAAFSADRQRKQSNETDARKYKPGLDPLEKEEKLQMIVPSSTREQNQMLKLVKRLIEKTKDDSEKRALKMWKANLKADQLKGVVQQEFLRDFWAWLIGRGKQEDHDKTPWGRQSLADDDEVSNYVDVFVTKMYEFRLKLAQLRIRRPIGINQVYLYFKYVVRGEEINKSNFLDDWSLFHDEFYEARNRGQFYRDEKEYPYPHEMAPYGDERKRIANEVEKKRRDAGPLTGDSDDEIAPEPQQPEKPNDEQPEIREMDEKEWESQHPDVPETAAAAQSFADVLDSMFELQKTPEQRVADADAAVNLVQSELEEMDTTEDVAVDEKNSTLRALDELKRERENRERDRDDRHRKRRDRIRAGTARRAAEAINNRVNELGKNAAEGLQTREAVVQEASQMREDIQSRENMDFSDDSPDTAEQFAEIQSALFAAETTEKLFRAPAAEIPTATAELRREATKPVKAAEAFQPPEIGNANFVAAVVENVRFLPKPVYVETVASAVAADDAAKKAEVLLAGEKRTRKTGDPFSEETGPVDEEPENTEPTKRSKAVEGELIDVVENETEKVAAKATRVKKSARVAAKSAVKLSGAVQTKSRLSELDNRLRDRLRAEKVAAELQSKADEIIEQVARQREKIRRASEGVKRVIETEEASLPAANEAATKAAEQLESEYDRASREISRKQRHIAKDAQADVARAEAFVNELRSAPVAPQFQRTTVTPPLMNVQASAQEEVNRVAAGQPPPIAPQFVRSTVTPPQMNVQSSVQEEVNRVAAGQPPPIQPQFVRTTVPVEPTPPGFVRTTVTPPQMNVQASAQEEVNRVAAGQPPPIAPQFVRTTVPPKEKEEEDEVVEIPPAENKAAETKTETTIPAERRGFTAGMTEEEFDRAIKTATAAAIEMEAKKFNQVLFDIRELAGRYAPELMHYFKPWDGQDAKQKEHLIELSVEVNRRIQKLGQRVSKPLNKDFAKRLKEKAERRREKVKLRPQFGGKLAEWTANRPTSRAQMEEIN